MSFTAAISTPDAIVAIVCALAAVRGAIKGFAWQAVRTIGLGASFLGAAAWHESVGLWLEENVSFVPDGLAKWIAWAGIFVVLLLLATYIAWMMKGALKRAKLGGLDRLLGFGLGAVVGLAIVTAGFLIWGRFAPAQTVRDTLKGSVTVPYMAKLVDVIEPVLPADVREKWSHVLDTLDGVVEEPAEQP